MALADAIEFFAATDVGRKRSHNEDNLLVDKDLGLFIVADGMGGHAAGEVASAIAVRVVHEVLSSQRELLAERAAAPAASTDKGTQQVLGLLEYAVNTASARIHAEAAKDTRLRGMGTTVSLLLVLGSHGYVAHVGDSRIYLMRAGSVHQVTEDHTVANELLRLGMVTKDQLDKVPRKNAITRGVGVYQHVEVDTLTLEVLPSDRFLLCSDGLAGYFDDTGEPMAPFLGKPDGEEIVRDLIDFANAHGGKDNITAVVVRLGGGDVSDSLRAKRLALKREVLAAMPLFSRLSEREMMRVMAAADVQSFEPGQVVVREGEAGDTMFVILDGSAKVEKGTTKVSSLKPGDQMGEMALIRSNARSATVTALEHSELICIRRADFFEIIRAEPHIAVKLLWQFINVLADRLDQTSRDLSTAREELNAVDISEHVLTMSDNSTPSQDDPFAQPPATLALGAFRLGFGAPLRTTMESIVPENEIVDETSFDDGPMGPIDPSAAPPLPEKIVNEPSFDDAPPLAGRIADEPSFDDAPPLAARIATPSLQGGAAPVNQVPATPPIAPSTGAAVSAGVDPAEKPGDQEPDTRRRFEERLAQRLRQLEELEENRDVPFDAKKTRPGTPVGRRRAVTVPTDGPKRPRSRTLKSAAEEGETDAPAEARADFAAGPVDPPPGTREPAEPRRAETLRSDLGAARGSGPAPQEGARPIRIGTGTLTGGTGAPAVDAKPKPIRKDDADLKATVPLATKKSAENSAKFRPTKETLPIEPSDELRSELEELRQQFKERLAKSREDRNKKGD
jgi:serine/threonine protein phosphatase PrpC/CRP-like cAMP-binding protein